MMSCLTRKLQQHLLRYLRQHREIRELHNPDSIRNMLIVKGLCPSDVTTDQVQWLLESANG